MSPGPTPNASAMRSGTIAPPAALPLTTSTFRAALVPENNHPATGPLSAWTPPGSVTATTDPIA